MELKPIIISAPFGNWFNYPGATSTLGTFTLKYRGGIFYRLWRMFLTLRYDRYMKGWVNRLGLPNPGIDSLSSSESIKEDTFFSPMYWGEEYRQYEGKIVSIHGFNASDWYSLIDRLRHFRWGYIELNLSCPNVGHTPSIEEVIPAIEHPNIYRDRLIAKLPPVEWMKLAIPLYDVGIRMFHCCNTLPCPSGGLSGKTLKRYSLCAVNDIKTKWGDDVTVIGGGGVTHMEDYRDHKNAGADHVAIASVLLNPFNWSRIKRLIAEVNDGIRNIDKREEGQQTSPNTIDNGQGKEDTETPSRD